MVVKVLVILVFFVSKILSDRCDPCECDVTTTYSNRIRCTEETVEFFHRIEKIPRVNFTKEVRWIELQIKKQTILGLQKEEFLNTGLSSLINIIIMYSNLTIIHPEAFNNLSYLTLLDLSHNNIQDILDETFLPTKRIQYLYLASNKLTTINDKLLSGLNNLIHLTLDNNLIYRFHQNALLSNNKLQIFHLNDNQLTYLNVSTISRLTQLSDFKIANNPWICDCFLRNLLDFIRSNKTKFYKEQLKETVCKFPDTRQTVWRFLQSEALNCWLEVSINEKNKNLRVGETFKIACIVYASPFPQVNWYLNNHLIDTSQRKYNVSWKSVDKVHFHFFLEVHNVTFDDQGAYKCVFNNVLNQSKNAEIEINLKGRRIDSSSVAIITGLVICFVCIVIILLKCAIKCCVVYHSDQNQSNFNDTAMEEVDLNKVKTVEKRNRKNGFTEKSANRI